MRRHAGLVAQALQDRLRAFDEIERGEVDGRFIGTSSVASTLPTWMQPDGPMRAILQFARATRLPEFPDVPTAREAALLSRADLASAIDAYAVSEKKLERAVARQYPEVSLRPGYYWDHGIAKWPLDVDFALPVFNRNEGEIAQARAAREVAGQKLLALQAAIYGDVDAALRADTVAAESLDAARRRGDSLRRQLAHADAALKLGAGDSLGRANAEVLVLRAELEALQAAAQRQGARNALEDALHAPLSGPELELARAWTVADSGAGR